MTIPRPAAAALWTLAAVYAFARVLQLFPRVPLLLMVALHVFPPLLFALVHGAFVYRLRGMAVFCALSFVLGNVFENLSILTGFPFGHYHFTEVMGPKLFLVPLTLGLAYLGIGYLAWTIGCLLARGAFLVPAVATLAMVAWDVSMEPVWSTVLRCWIWRDGGAYFGAPLSNFFGWCLTNYVIYQSFALYLRRRNQPRQVDPSAWRMAVLYYTLCTAGNMLVALTPSSAAVALDAAGVAWSVAALTRVCAAASLLFMGPFALLAWRGARANAAPGVAGS